LFVEVADEGFCAGGVWARAAVGILGSIVGAVAEETEAVGAEVDAEGEVLVDDASGLAPPPQAASNNEAARMATGVFFTVPPTGHESTPAVMVSTADQHDARTCLNKQARTPHTRHQWEYARFAA
jgi:hypothetical protein